MTKKQIILLIIMIVFTITAIFIYIVSDASASFFVSIFAAIGTLIPLIIDFRNNKIKIISQEGGVEEVNIESSSESSIEIEGKEDVKKITINEKGVKKK